MSGYMQRHVSEMVKGMNWEWLKQTYSSTTATSKKLKARSKSKAFDDQDEQEDEQGVSVSVGQQYIVPLTSGIARMVS